MTFTLPLAIWTLSAFFREIPWDLDKAARVDGATPFQAFRRVIAPLAAPGVFTSAILVFIFAWNDFLFATSLTSTNRARTVPAAIAFFTGGSQFDFPAGPIAAAVGGGDHPDHRHGADLPAPHRRRAHVRRGEGMNGGPTDGRDRADKLTKRYADGSRRCRGGLHDRRRRVLHPRRAVGLREVDAAAT